jgi:Tfp pilus assembly protein PilF
MSLLLEALKKAEKAKEEAQRGAREGAAPEAQPDAELAAAETTKRVITRDELPDISAPLEILTEDLTANAPRTLSMAAPNAGDPPATPAASPELGPAPRRDPPRAAAAAEQSSVERVMARTDLEARFREPNPRLPFYIAVGVLSVAAVATAVYFWMQLRPPASLVNPNPPRAAAEKPADPAAPAPPTGTQTAQGQLQAPIPGLPPTPPTTAPAAAPVTSPPSGSVPTPAATTPVAPAEAKPTPPGARSPRGDVAARPATRPAEAAAARSDAQKAAPADPPLTFTRAAPQVHPRVAAGYGAYQAGDLPKARDEYQQALNAEPTNRDALLGLAAVEMRAQRYDVAESLYQRLLRADPRDPHANSGLMALRSQQLDPVLSESRVKTLLAANPDSGVLYFTLGNQLAQQGRWPEAQQAYFKAHTADPENPDFAFNLAVSLDQVRQPGLALEHYRRALLLAEKRVANFSLEAARTRIQQLSR